MVCVVFIECLHWAWNVSQVLRSIILYQDECIRWSRLVCTCFKGKEIALLMPLFVCLKWARKQKWSWQPVFDRCNVKWIGQRGWHMHAAHLASLFVLYSKEKKEVGLVKVMAFSEWYEFHWCKTYFWSEKATVRVGIQERMLLPVAQTIGDSPAGMSIGSILSRYHNSIHEFCFWAIILCFTSRSVNRTQTKVVIMKRSCLSRA